MSKERLLTGNRNALMDLFTPAPRQVPVFRPKKKRPETRYSIWMNGRRKRMKQRFALDVRKGHGYEKARKVMRNARKRERQGRK